nr:hypothetical protein [Tanacetum cinerariifolium]
ASSPSTTPIVDKINKIEKLIIKGKVTLVDDEGKPLEKVASSCEYDSEDEVASVDNEMANFLAKKDGYVIMDDFDIWWVLVVFRRMSTDKGEMVTNFDVFSLQVLHRVSAKVTLIASSPSNSSSTKVDVLDGGGVSSNVTLSDSLI